MRNHAQREREQAALIHALRNKLTAIAGDAAVIAELTADGFEAGSVNELARDVARVSDEAIDLLRRLFAQPPSGS